MSETLEPMQVIEVTAAVGVRAFTTTRRGGLSVGSWGLHRGAAGGLNLGTRCGDDPVAVQGNRDRLRMLLPAAPRWLEQVHGTVVLRFDRDRAGGDIEPVADASVTRDPRVVLAVQTADCLPVFLWDARGRAIGLAHAGWRGLAAGILERTVAALRGIADDIAQPLDVRAHLGPGIGPSAFEVGEDVRHVFFEDDPGSVVAFMAAGTPGKWLADLPALARRRLARVGVSEVTGGEHCTFADAARFYSHRRDRVSGRMASVIWIDG